MKLISFYMCAFLFFSSIPGFLLSADQGQNSLISSIQEFRSSNEHKIISEFFQLLSIPNVAKDKENIKKNAHFIKKMMEKRGIKSRIIPTEGSPVVFGELKVKGAKQTLLFYVHYDGQPVDPSKWTDSQPFNPVLRKGKLNSDTNLPKPIALPSKNQKLDPDWRIYARSSSDDKAPIISILSALDALKENGYSLKNNLKFIFEGEEEAGSPNIKGFLEKNKELLKSDVLFMCDGPAYFSGSPTLVFGVKGITSIEITVYGPKVSLHSGHYGNWAPNPAMRLVQLLSTMKTPDGNIIIKDFYNTVTPFTQTEIDAIRGIPSYENQLKELYGFSHTESGSKSFMEAILYPSLNINGLSSGWVGDQARTIVPPIAIASIDIRLAKGNEPGDMVQKVIKHIESQGFHVVHQDPDDKTRKKYSLIAKVVNAEKGYKAARTSMDHKISQRVIRALKQAYKNDLALIPSMGGSLPIYLFENSLKIPFMIVPIVNHDNNQHQPDENVRIGNLWKGMETFAVIIMMDS
jgi:acetylornithine deacetylase/succinyl-diaminopimelate desuccinylase-like protein